MTFKLSRSNSTADKWPGKVVVAFVSAMFSFRTSQRFDVFLYSNVFPSEIRHMLKAYSPHLLLLSFPTNLIFRRFISKKCIYIMCILQCHFLFGKPGGVALSPYFLLSRLSIVGSKKFCFTAVGYQINPQLTKLMHSVPSVLRVIVWQTIFSGFSNSTVLCLSHC